MAVNANVTRRHVILGKAEDLALSALSAESGFNRSTLVRLAIRHLVVNRQQILPELAESLPQATAA